MEFLVVPQFNSSPLELFGRDEKGNTFTSECPDWMCVCFAGCYGPMCPNEAPPCDCNGNTPVCVPRACTVKTCVRNYSINGI